MVQSRGREKTFPSLHNAFRMLLSGSSAKSSHENDMHDNPDEPPEHHDDGVVYINQPTAHREANESLLTRALKSASPDLSPTEHPPSPPSGDHAFSCRRSYPAPANSTGLSAAELTSDGGIPSLSNSPSPPPPSRLAGKSPPPATTTQKMQYPEKKPSGSAADASESKVEANLGRKRCISFACSNQSKRPPPPPPADDKKNTEIPAAEPFKKKRTISFACPAREPEPRRERSPRRESCKPRQHRSPAPLVRRASQEQNGSSSVQSLKDRVISPPPPKERRGIPTSGLGKFEESEATRFHEFAGSVDEDPEWVTHAPEYKDKITLNDCLKKENAIRKLGEEAEEEQEEEEEEDDDDEEEEETDEDDDEDEADDVPDEFSVMHDLSGDEGNESDNEAGFADSDGGESDSEFWMSTVPIAWNPDTFRHTTARRDSNGSVDSLPTASRKDVGRRSKPIKMRAGPPSLPDSTDFVCGTLDEDRPLEAEYKSCIEQRRLSKQVPIPQDIDPSFPTSDLDEEVDSEDSDNERGEQHASRRDSRTTIAADQQQPRKMSPRPSPRKVHSPPPPLRRGRSSPIRPKSPPPPARALSPPSSVRQGSIDDAPAFPTRGFNISGLVQRPAGMTRTKSLPRSPNPFFAGLGRFHGWMSIPALEEFPAREDLNNAREVHTRGPVDIVEGLERKRQKRKEKYWRQHCRRAAKEEKERRPAPGRGAERMKELGLEAAERCRAYGVSQDEQLVISV